VMVVLASGMAALAKPSQDSGAATRVAEAVEAVKLAPEAKATPIHKECFLRNPIA